jgi:hypothetical protein
MSTYKSRWYDFIKGREQSMEIMEINSKELHPFVYQKLKSKSPHGIKI